MKYAVHDAKGVVMSVFDAESFGDAVEIKHRLERTYNEMSGSDNIFTVAKATRKAIPDFEPAGLVVARVVARKGRRV
jgi:hypothetical protein